MLIDATNSAAAPAATKQPNMGKVTKLNKMSEGTGNFGLLGV
jgi:hypothetical protein